VKQFALDFGDKHRPVGTGEAQVRGWDAMVFDVGRDMLVV